MIVDQLGRGYLLRDYSQAIAHIDHAREDQGISVPEIIRRMGGGSPTFIRDVLHGRKQIGGEAEARKFVALINDDGDWPYGPHLHKRSVDVGDWEEA